MEMVYSQLPRWKECLLKSLQVRGRISISESSKIFGSLMLFSCGLLFIKKSTLWILFKNEIQTCVSAPTGVSPANPQMKIWTICSSIASRLKSYGNDGVQKLVFFWQLQIPKNYASICVVSKVAVQKTSSILMLLWLLYRQYRLIGTNKSSRIRLQALRIHGRIFVLLLVVGHQKNRLLKHYS